PELRQGRFLAVLVGESEIGGGLAGFHHRGTSSVESSQSERVGIVRSRFVETIATVLEPKPDSGKPALRDLYWGSLMGSVETFDHPADLGMRLHSADVTALFRTAAEGLFDVILANRGDVRAEQAEPIRLRADSTAELLVEWLNELIFRSETEHRFYGRF